MKNKCLFLSLVLVTAIQCNPERELLISDRPNNKDIFENFREDKQVGSNISVSEDLKKPYDAVEKEVLVPFNDTSFLFDVKTNIYEDPHNPVSYALKQDQFKTPEEIEDCFSKKDCSLEQTAYVVQASLGKSNICLVSFFTYNLYKYAKISIPNHLAYARKHGYT